MTERVLPADLATLARAVGAGGQTPDLRDREWPAMLALADRHRVTALLAASFAAAELPDRKIAAELAKARLAHHAQYRRNERALADLARALADAGVWFVVLKGITVAERYYATPADRNAIDIDILVSERQLAAALAAVERLGFERRGPARSVSGTPDVRQLAAAPDLSLVRRFDCAKLELHWRLSRNRHFPAWPPDALAPHVEWISSNIGRLPALSPPALLVHLMLHGARHLWFRLKWLADIDRMVRSLADVQLHDAAAIAAELGCARAFHTGLSLAQSCFETPLGGGYSPEHRHSALHATMVRALADDVAVRERYTAADLRAGLSIGYGRFLLRPGRAYRIELLKRTLIGIEDAQRSVPMAVAAKIGRKLAIRRR